MKDDIDIQVILQTHSHQQVVFWPKLEWIDFEDNLLTGSLSNLTNDLCMGPVTLQYLALDNNPGLTPGPIPHCFCNITTLQQFRVGNTARTGVLPPCFFGASLPQLVNFSAWGNTLTGQLPLEVCKIGDDHLHGIWIGLSLRVFCCCLSDSRICFGAECFCYDWCYRCSSQ